MSPGYPRSSQLYSKPPVSPATSASAPAFRAVSPHWVHRISQHPASPDSVTDHEEPQPALVSAVALPRLMRIQACRRPRAHPIFYTRFLSHSHPAPPVIWLPARPPNRVVCQTLNRKEPCSDVDTLKVSVACHHQHLEVLYVHPPVRQ